MASVKCVKLNKDDAEMFDELTEGLRPSDVLRAAIGLLFAVVFSYDIPSESIGIIWTIRDIARKKGLKVAYCKRIAIDLAYHKVWCF